MLVTGELRKAVKYTGTCLLQESWRRLRNARGGEKWGVNRRGLEIKGMRARVEEKEVGGRPARGFGKTDGLAH